MYQNTITLFNYHANTDNWYTTIFANADLIENNGANATTVGIGNSAAVDLLINVRMDKASYSVVDKNESIFGADGDIIVPKENDNIVYINPTLNLEKRYANPKAYSLLDNPQPYFTFTPESDFFMIGDYYSNVPISDGRFEDGLYSAINAAYDGVYMVCSAAFYSLIPHFEIGGR